MPTLPAARSAPAPGVAAPPLVPARRGAADRLPVLYVEDHAVNAMLMRATLARRPRIELTVATSAAQAMQLARTLRPVLLLLDLGLPDGDGRELLGRLRTLDGLHDVPAVAVTADALADTDGFGFCDRWDKPLDVMRVIDRIDTLLETGSDPSRAQALPALDGAFVAGRTAQVAKRFRTLPPGEH